MRAAILLGAVLLAGCGQRLVVRNMDPTLESAEIWVDERAAGKVAFRGELSIPLEEGPHVVHVRTYEGERRQDRGRPLTVVLEEDATLTLLPLVSE